MYPTETENVKGEKFVLDICYTSCSPDLARSPEVVSDKAVQMRTMFNHLVK